jgi:AcrR family transcriptional regulator
MPRLPDPELEGEILDAAQRLWKKKGEEGLTMRAVAKAAGTNTPSVYRRFQNREDILRGLLQRIRLDIASEMQDIASPEEGCARYLEYALRHPREYELFFQKEYKLFHSPNSKRARVKPTGRPVREIMRRKIAERLGGSPAEYESVLLALQMLTHGAAMLLIAKTILPKDAEKARSVFEASVGALLEAAGEL